MSVPKVIGGPAEATARWLTAVLRAVGALTRGGADRVETFTPVEGGYSLLWPLRVTYSAGADASAPAALLLKVPRPDIDAEQTASKGRRARPAP